MLTQNIFDHSIQIVGEFLKYFIFFFILLTLLKIIYDFLVERIVIDPSDEEGQLNLLNNNIVLRHPILHKIKTIDNIFKQDVVDSQREKLDAKEKVIAVQSNCPLMTMVMIKVILENPDDFEPANIYTQLSYLENDERFKSIVREYKEAAKPTVVVDCDDSSPKRVSTMSDRFSSSDMKERIIFVSKHKLELDNVVDHEINHDKTQISDDFLQEMLDIQVNFQGTIVKLSDIVSPQSQIIDVALLEKIIGSENIAVSRKVDTDKIANYIERKYLPDITNNDNNTKTVDIEYSRNQMSNFMKLKKIILLVDELGMGKTWEFLTLAENKHISKIKKWTLYIDFENSFDSHEEENVLFDTCEMISSFVWNTFIKEEIFDGFDRKLFVDLFKSNRVIFFADGFDKICLNDNQLILKLLKSIKSLTKNELWISSRPQQKLELENYFQTEAYKLKPFTDQNKKDFISKCLKNIVDDIRIPKACSDIENFLLPIQTHFTITPLFLHTVTEIWINELKNNSVDPNLYLIYSKFISRILEWSINESSEASESSKTKLKNGDVDAFLHEKAFQLHFSGKSGDGIKELLAQSFTYTCSFDLKEISDIKLMFIDESRLYQFIGRAFIEFYVADFFFKKIFEENFKSDSELENILKVLFKIFDDFRGDFDAVKIFLNHAIESSKNQKPSKKVQKAFLKIVEKSNNNYIFHWLARAGCINLIRSISHNFIQDEQKEFEMWSRQEINKSLKNPFFGGNSGGLIRNISDNFKREKSKTDETAQEASKNFKLSFTVLTAAVERQSLEFITQLFGFAYERFGYERMKILLFSKTDKNVNSIFSFAVRNPDREVFRFVMETARTLSQEGWEELLAEKQLWGNKSLYSSLRNRSNQNIFEGSFNNLRKYFEKDELQLLLKSKCESPNEKGWNILHVTCLHQSPETIKTVCNTLREILDPVDEKMIFRERISSSGYSAVNHAAESKHEQAFETLWPILEKVIVDISDKKELLDGGKEKTPFHCMVTGGFAKDKFYFAKSLYEKIFGLEGLQKIALMEMAGINLLLLQMAYRIDNDDTLLNFWGFLQELFDEKTIKHILLKRDDKAATFLQNVAAKARMPDAIFRLIFPYILQTFSEDEMLHVGLTWFLFYNAKKLSLKTFDTFFTSFHSYETTPPVMTQLFLLRDSKDKNISHLAASNKDFKVHACIVENAKKFGIKIQALIQTESAAIAGM